MYDVAIVGAGVTGCFIAKELSKYNLNVAVFEERTAPGLGQTKGCSGIIHPFQLPFGSLRGKLCIEGNRMMDAEAEELGFRFKRVGLLLVATNRLTALALPILRRYLSRYVEVREVDREELLRMEPNLSENVRGALFFPSAGVVNPVEMTFAAYLFAKTNGVDFFFDCKVVGIRRRPDRFIVETTKGSFEARFVVNCAGLYADEVARMVGYEMRITPGKGSHIVFGEKGFTRHIIAAIPFKPNRRTKGGGALVTIDGIPIWGPTLVDVEDKEDTSVTAEEVERIIAKFSPLFKRMPRDVIAFYAGVRSIAGRDFVINQPVRNFINVAGIQSPGLTAAPAIAKMVLRMLAGSGLKLKKKENIVKPRLIRFAELSDDERAKLIESDPAYGRILCLCNLVTEKEVEEVLKHAPSFDAVKHVTRAGMRCWRCHADIIVFMQRVANKTVKDSEGSDLAW